MLLFLKGFLIRRTFYVVVLLVKFYLSQLACPYNLLLCGHYYARRGLPKILLVIWAPNVLLTKTLKSLNTCLTPRLKVVTSRPHENIIMSFAHVSRLNLFSYINKHSSIKKIAETSLLQLLYVTYVWITHAQQIYYQMVLLPESWWRFLVHHPSLCNWIMWSLKSLLELTYSKENAGVVIRCHFVCLF